MSIAQTALRYEVFERSPIARALRRRFDYRFTGADVQRLLREIRTARILRDRLSREFLRSTDPRERLYILLGRRSTERLRERLSPADFQRLLELIMSPLFGRIAELYEKLLNTAGWDRIRWPWGVVVVDPLTPGLGVDVEYMEPEIPSEDFESFLDELMDLFDEFPEEAIEEIPEEPIEVPELPADVEVRKPRAPAAAPPPGPPVVEFLPAVSGFTVGVGLAVPAGAVRGYVSPTFTGPVLLEHGIVNIRDAAPFYLSPRVIPIALDPNTALSAPAVAGYAVFESASNFIPAGFQLELTDTEGTLEFWPALFLPPGTWRLYLVAWNQGTVTGHAQMFADLRYMRAVGS